MSSTKLHPIACEMLAAFSRHGYFSSNKLCRTLAENSPRHCVEWAYRVATPVILAASPPPNVTDTIEMVGRCLMRDEIKLLTELDAVATESWASGSYSASSPYLQRAAARLAWATMCRISHTTGADFDTKFAGVAINARKDAFTEMVNQSAMAIDMTNRNSNDAPLILASSFSTAMEDRS